MPNWRIDKKIKSHHEEHAFGSGMFQTFKSFNTFKAFRNPFRSDGLNDLNGLKCAQYSLWLNLFVPLVAAALP